MEKQTLEFRPFQKIPRLNREVILTEKIDGTNACVFISEDFKTVGAQSRSRIITPESDNFGFAAWVEEHRDDLKNLGPGYHFGEWWGAGIQRGYGLKERRFSLFNVSRWGPSSVNDYRPRDYYCPGCCHVVPVLARCDIFDSLEVEAWVEHLRVNGSEAAPGFMYPEGVIVFHTASNNLYKVTLEKDEEPKGKNGTKTDRRGSSEPQSIRGDIL